MQINGSKLKLTIPHGIYYALSCIDFPGKNQLITCKINLTKCMLYLTIKRNIEKQTRQFVLHYLISVNAKYSLPKLSFDR